MNRINRVAIWGACESIWNAIKHTLNPISVNVTVFVDSDKNKQGLLFHGIPIISVDELDESMVDFIVIAAYSGMQEIRKVLESKGVKHEKIQPFITKWIYEYNVGDISDMNWEKSSGLYFKPITIREIASEYIMIYREFSRLSPERLDEGAWYYDNRLVAHAGGGYVNGIKISTTNSRDSVLEVIKQNYLTVEVDVTCDPDGNWWLGHGCDFMANAIENGCTLMPLHEFIRVVGEKDGFSCILDVKYEKRDEYSEFLIELENIISKFEYKDIKSRIIMEVYDEMSMQEVYKLGYQMIYAQYKNPDWKCFMKTALLCRKYQIQVLTMPVWNIDDHIIKGLVALRDIGIICYIYSINTPEEYSCVLNKYGYGVMTDYLLMV